jgi:hypothetical protein
MQTITDPKTLALNKQQEIRDGIARVKKRHNEMKDHEGQFLRIRDFIMLRGWLIGWELVQLKEKVGFGEWDKWVPLNLPFLGDADETRRINARRMMKLYRDNQSPKLLRAAAAIESKSVGIPTDLKGKVFDTASERKFMWQYVPAKERPNTKDIRFPRSVSFINMVNEYNRLKQRHIEGLQLVDFNEVREEAGPLTEKLNYELRTCCPHCTERIVDKDPWES